MECGCPLAEKYYSVSPSAFCSGNPVNFVDPDGESWCFWENSGRMIAHVEDDDSELRQLRNTDAGGNSFGEMLKNGNVTTEAALNVLSFFLTCPTVNKKNQRLNKDSKYRKDEISRHLKEQKNRR